MASTLQEEVQPVPGVFVAQVVHPLELTALLC